VVEAGGRSGESVRSVRVLRVRQVWRWLSVALWMAVIFYVSAQPDLPRHPTGTLDVILKKAGHFVEYGILAGLLCWAWAPDDRASKKNAIVGAFAVAALYAVSDEIHQWFVPGRTSRPLDVAFDLAGAATALLILRRLFPPGGDTGRR
jgi:VanZ family protein